MRPAKFFIALLFGAAVLITFLKLLFFAIMAAAVFGTLFFVFRAGRYMGGRQGYAQSRFGPANYPPMRFNERQHAQPIDPRRFQNREKQAFTRGIEVL